MILILSFIVSQLKASDLFSSSFTSTTFSDLDGWTILSSFPISAPVAVKNGLSYAGYGSLLSQSLLEETLIKQFFNLPSHFAVEIRAKLFVRSELPSGQAAIFLRGDSVQIEANNIYFYPQQQEIEYYVSAITTHYGNSIVVSFAMSSDFHSQQITFGMREFQLFTKKCPSTCVFCQIGRLTESECIIWTLGHRSIFDSVIASFSNDGWTMMDKYKTTNDDNEQTQIYECTKDAVSQFSLFPIMGLAQYTQLFEITITLEPHYKIYISYLQFIINPLRYESVYWVGEINGNVEYDVKLRMLTAQARICDYSKSLQTSGDQLLRIQNEIHHQNTTLVFRSYTMQYTPKSLSRWGIRDFEIYIAKCHSSCQYTCNGPKESDCITINYPKFILFGQSFQDNTFIDLDSWQIVQPIAFSSTICNGQSMIGGDKDLQVQYMLQKLYTFSKHISIQISFKFYLIDAVSNDVLYVAVDGNIIHQITLDVLTDKKILKPICGVYTIYDIVYTVQTPKIDHNKLQSTIQIYTNQPITSPGYWAIREFQIKLDGKTYLKEFSESKFSADGSTSAWTLTPNIQTIALCGSLSFIKIEGSTVKNSSLRKLITSLPDHKQLKISFTLYLYGSSIQQVISIVLDGTSVWSKKLNNQLIYYCDNTHLSTVYRFSEIFWQSNATVLIEIQTNLIENQYWGIRDFNLQYNNEGVD